MPPRELSQKYLSKFQNASLVEMGPTDITFDDIEDITQTLKKQDPRNLTPDVLAKIRRKKLREMTTDKFINEDTSSDGESEE
jgi:hypothetical protein